MQIKHSKANDTKQYKWEKSKRKLFDNDRGNDEKSHLVLGLSILYSILALLVQQEN